MGPGCPLLGIANADFGGTLGTTWYYDQNLPGSVSSPTPFSAPQSISTIRLVSGTPNAGDTLIADGLTFPSTAVNSRNFDAMYVTPKLASQTITAATIKATASSFVQAGSALVQSAIAVYTVDGDSFEIDETIAYDISAASGGGGNPYKWTTTPTSRQYPYSFLNPTTLSLGDFSIAGGQRLGVVLGCVSEGGVAWQCTCYTTHYDVQHIEFTTNFSLMTL